MSLPVDLDNLEKTTRRREFDDGLMDYAVGVIFLVLSLLAWFLFSPKGLRWYALALVNYHTLTLVGLLFVAALVITVPVGLRRLIEYLRISTIWKDSGFIKPLNRQTSWPLTILSVVVALGMILYASWLMTFGKINPGSVLRTLVSSSGIATGIIYIGLGASLNLRRYLILGLAGGMISVLILFLPVSFSIAWLILGITWALLLFVSGTWALHHLLSLKKESSSE